LNASNWFGLFLIFMWIAGAVGWVLNIIAVVHTCCDPLTGVLAVRIAGIFVLPIGAVMGYI
jgi:hypothetical protein